MAATFAAIWALVGVVLVLIVGQVDPDSIDAGEGPRDVALILGTVGFGTGALCGVLLWLAERGRRFAEVPLLRAAVWGVVAGALLPFAGNLPASVLANTCPLGALSAPVAVLLLRRIARARLASR
jgi:hypothetical protein